MFINDSNIGTKSGLDEKFFTGYDWAVQPDQLQPEDRLFFRQKVENQFGYFQHADFAGPGNLTKVARGESVPSSSVRIFNKQTSEIFSYKEDIDFTAEDMEDSDVYAVVQDSVTELGVAARQSEVENLLKMTYGNPFDATNNPTRDGLAFISNSHINGNGDTVDNYRTGVLNSDNLKLLVRDLKLQSRQGGGLGGYAFRGLLVALNLLETAREITNSQLKPNTANNNANVFYQNEIGSGVYEGITVKTSEYLHSTYNALNSAVDTTYFVTADSTRHSVTKVMREALSTPFIDPRFSKTDTGYYRAKFRMTAFPGSYAGVAGSDGTV
jgi:hypothetical protein